MGNHKFVPLKVSGRVGGQWCRGVVAVLQEYRIFAFSKDETGSGLCKATQHARTYHCRLAMAAEHITFLFNCYFENILIVLSPSTKNVYDFYY